jgi:hypothetical protein
MGTIYSGNHAFQSTTIVGGFLKSSSLFLSHKPHNEAVADRSVARVRENKSPALLPGIPLCVYAGTFLLTGLESSPIFFKNFIVIP